MSQLALPEGLATSLASFHSTARLVSQHHQAQLQGCSALLSEARRKNQQQSALIVDLSLKFQQASRSLLQLQPLRARVKQLQAEAVQTKLAFSQSIAVKLQLAQSREEATGLKRQLEQVQQELAQTKEQIRQAQQKIDQINEYTVLGRLNGQLSNLRAQKAHLQSRVQLAQFKLQVYQKQLPFDYFQNMACQSFQMQQGNMRIRQQLEAALSRQKEILSRVFQLELRVCDLPLTVQQRILSYEQMAAKLSHREVSVLMLENELQKREDFIENLCRELQLKGQSELDLGMQLQAYKKIMQELSHKQNQVLKTRLSQIRSKLRKETYKLPSAYQFSRKTLVLPEQPAAETERMQLRRKKMVLRKIKKRKLWGDKNSSQLNQLKSQLSKAKIQIDRLLKTARTDSESTSPSSVIIKDHSLDDQTLNKIDAALQLKSELSCQLRQESSQHLNAQYKLSQMQAKIHRLQDFCRSLANKNQVLQAQLQSVPTQQQVVEQIELQKLEQLFQRKANQDLAELDSNQKASLISKKLQDLQRKVESSRSNYETEIMAAKESHRKEITQLMTHIQKLESEGLRGQLKVFEFYDAEIERLARQNCELQKELGQAKEEVHRAKIQFENLASNQAVRESLQVQEKNQKMFLLNKLTVIEEQHRAQIDLWQNRQLALQKQVAVLEAQNLCRVEGGGQRELLVLLAQRQEEVEQLRRKLAEQDKSESECIEEEPEYGN